MIINLENFIFERYGTNNHVKHMTKLIFNKINQYIQKLIRTKEDIIIKNFLKDNYKKLKFENDNIIISLKGKTYVNEPIIENDIIKDFKLYLKIDKKYLNNNYISDKSNFTNDINHELNHLIDVYYTKSKNVKLSKSFEFDKRLKIHEEKYSFFDKWLEITHIFYLMEKHEVNSKVSSMREDLEKLNSNDANVIEKFIKNSSLYKECDNISKLNSNSILNFMYKKYNTYFDKILKDFIKNVILNNSDDIKLVFDKEIEIIKKNANRMKKMLLRTSYNYIIIERMESLGEQIQKDINFTNYQ